MGYLTTNGIVGVDMVKHRHRFFVVTGHRTAREGLEIVIHGRAGRRSLELIDCAISGLQDYEDCTENDSGAERLQGAPEESLLSLGLSWIALWALATNLALSRFAPRHAAIASPTTAMSNAPPTVMAFHAASPPT